MVEGGIKFGTKAETLLRLKPHLRTGRILDLEYFTVTDWENSPNEVLERISSRFGKGSLVVRSSAQGEDGADNSMAGAYESILGVSGEDSEVKSICNTVWTDSVKSAWETKIKADLA